MPKMLWKLMCSLGQSYPCLLQASEAAREDTRGIPWPTFTHEKAFNKKKYHLILLLLQRSAELWKNTPLQKGALTAVSSNRSINKRTYALETTRTGSRVCTCELITRSLAGEDTAISYQLQPSVSSLHPVISTSENYVLVSRI